MILAFSLISNNQEARKNRLSGRGAYIHELTLNDSSLKRPCDRCQVTW